jgi:hypothetical protein
LLLLPDLDVCCGCGGTMEKEDCTQLETEEETSCTAAKKQIKKKKRYDNPRKWFEGRKLIVRGKAPLEESGHEIHSKLKKKTELNQELRRQRETNKDIRSGEQKTITSMFQKK